MTILDFESSSSHPLLPPTTLLVLFFLLSPALGAPKQAQEGSLGSSLIRLGQGQDLYLPNAIRDVLGGMEGTTVGTETEGQLSIRNFKGNLDARSEVEVRMKPNTYA
jgi:hypothetical protein